VSVLSTIADRVVAIGDARGHGAGVIWDDGLVVTNHHVVPGPAASLTTARGDQAIGQVVARDRRRDLALLAVPWVGFAGIEVGPAPQVGEMVLAMGHPLGHAYHTSMGIVSAIESGLLHADLKLAPGNSGGPVIDALGRLVGIAAMVRYPGVGLAVPASVASEFVNRYVRSGAVAA